MRIRARVKNGHIRDNCPVDLPSRDGHSYASFIAFHIMTPMRDSSDLRIICGIRARLFVISTALPNAQNRSAGSSFPSAGL
jgi:hypothetical protein